MPPLTSSQILAHYSRIYEFAIHFRNDAKDALKQSQKNHKSSINWPHLKILFYLSEINSAASHAEHVNTLTLIHSNIPRLKGFSSHRKKAQEAIGFDVKFTANNNDIDKYLTRPKGFYENIANCSTAIHIYRAGTPSLQTWALKGGTYS